MWVLALLIYCAPYFRYLSSQKFVCQNFWIQKIWAGYSGLFGRRKMWAYPAQKNSSLSYLHVVSKAVKQLTLKAVDDQLMNFRHIANIFHLISSNFHVFRFIREKIKYIFYKICQSNQGSNNWTMLCTKYAHNKSAKNSINTVKSSSYLLTLV